MGCREFYGWCRFLDNEWSEHSKMEYYEAQSAWLFACANAKEGHKPEFSTFLMGRKETHPDDLLLYDY